MPNQGLHVLRAQVGRPFPLLVLPQDQGGGRPFRLLWAWDPMVAEEIRCLPVEARRGGVGAVGRGLSLCEESVGGTDGGAGS